MDGKFPSTHVPRSPNNYLYHIVHYFGTYTEVVLVVFDIAVSCLLLDGWYLMHRDIYEGDGVW